MHWLATGLYVVWMALLIGACNHPGPCPKSLVEETAAAANAVSVCTEYDWNCNGAVDVNDVIEAQAAEDECRSPRRSCCQ